MDAPVDQRRDQLPYKETAGGSSPPGGTKFCPKCESEKSISDFHKRLKSVDGRQAVCKRCACTTRLSYYREDPTGTKAYAVARVKRNLEYARRFLASGCVDCYERDIDALDFDHVKGDKRTGVMQLARYGVSIETLQAEIDKCEVRCANCHRKVTRRRERESL